MHQALLLLLLLTTFFNNVVAAVNFPEHFNTPLTLLMATHKEGPKDYCGVTNYEPRCPSKDHVILIDTAVNGRMNDESSCLSTNFGYTGCSANVLIQAHHHCSGRYSCSVRLPDEMFEDMTINHCLKDLKFYLSASHVCVPVDVSSCSHCYSHHNEKSFALSSFDSGYFSSAMSLPSPTYNGCGTDRCPWLVEVRSGQTINLTLYDFGLATLYKNNSNTCYKYGKVHEHAFQRHSSICGGKNLTSNLYASMSNALEIINYLVNASMGQYLIYYQAIGCADYDNPAGSTTKRYHDKIIVTCNNSLWINWEVRCVKGRWEGEVGVCPDSMKAAGALSLPLGVLIAIVLGIALVIGVLIVTVGIVYLKKQQRELLYPPYPSYSFSFAQEPYYDAMDPKTLQAFNTIQRKKQQQQEFEQQQMLTLQKQQLLQQQQLQQQTLDKKSAKKKKKKSRSMSDAGRNVYTKATMESRPLPSIPSNKNTPTSENIFPPFPQPYPIPEPQLPASVPQAVIFSSPQSKRTVSPMVQIHVAPNKIPPSSSSTTLKKPAKPVRSSSTIKASHPQQSSQPQQVLNQQRPQQASEQLPPPPTQHYTMLDPLEVQQLIARLPQQQQQQYHPLLNYQQQPQPQHQQLQQQLLQQPFPPPPPLLDSDEELALRPAREGIQSNNNPPSTNNNNTNSSSDCLANSSWP